MKNVMIVPTRPSIRIPIHGAPPLQGWALKLLMDIPVANYKKGYWMSRWSSDTEAKEFAFESGLHMVFNTEDDAKKVSAFLRSEGEIETDVVKIGDPPTAAPPEEK